MIRPIRSQEDAPEAFEAASLAAAKEFDPKEDKARQEFKQESDANWLIKKYGANVPMAPTRFGEAYFDSDALSARLQASTLHGAFAALPEAIRAKYGNWQAVLEAIERGELTTFEQKAGSLAEGTSAGASA